MSRQIFFPPKKKLNTEILGMYIWIFIFLPVVVTFLAFHFSSPACFHMQNNLIDLSLFFSEREKNLKIRLRRSPKNEKKRVIVLYNLTHLDSTVDNTQDFVSIFLV